MRISPVTGPGAVQDLSTPEAVRTSRAVNAFKQAANNQQAQEHPVQNPSQVSVEELGAIQAKSQPTEIRDNSTEVSPEVTQEEQKPEAKDPALERQFAQLARQERVLRAKAQQQAKALEAREAALAVREAELATKSQQDLSNYISKDRFKQDALSALEEAGASYDDLTAQVLNRQPTDPRVTSTISRLEAKIAELERANESTQKSYKDQQQAQYQAAVKQIEQDAKSLVKNDPNFETIRVTGSVKDVVELITETYNKDGILLTVEEAATQVEDYLVEEATKLTRIGKIKARLEKANASPTQSAEKTPANTQQRQKPQMKTLTNATGSTRQLSVRERAIAAMEGRLK